MRFGYEILQSVWIAGVDKPDFTSVLDGFEFFLQCWSRDVKLTPLPSRRGYRYVAKGDKKYSSYDTILRISSSDPRTSMHLE